MRVNTQRVGECGHTLNSDNLGSHFPCKCCERGTNAPVMDGKTGRFVCVDCYTPAVLPKPVSFRDEVVMAQVIQACMFCSGRATFCFADTGEPICERCIDK